MWHPYDKQADFFYPARRQVTFYFAATVLQFPYILCPHDADLWFYVRSFGIIYYPMCAAMMFHRYFRLGHGNLVRVDGVRGLGRAAQGEQPDGARENGSKQSLRHNCFLQYG